MKKNNDYFEMLWSLSSKNTEITLCLMEEREIGISKLEFFELQSTFYEKISEAFVAPVERADLYSLSNCLEAQLNALCAFSLVLQFESAKVFRETLYALCNISRDNTEVFKELKSNGTAGKVNSLLWDNKRAVSSLELSCRRTVLALSVGKQTGSTDVKTEGYRSLERILSSIYSVISETERMIINNC